MLKKRKLERIDRIFRREIARRKAVQNRNIRETKTNLILNQGPEWNRIARRESNLDFSFGSCPSLSHAVHGKDEEVTIVAVFAHAAIITIETEGATVSPFVRIQRSRPKTAVYHVWNWILRLVAALVIVLVESLSVLVVNRHSITAAFVEFNATQMARHLSELRQGRKLRVHRRTVFFSVVLGHAACLTNSSFWTILHCWRP